MVVSIGCFWEKVKKTLGKGLGIMSKNCVKREACVGHGEAHFSPSESKLAAVRDGGILVRCEAQWRRGKGVGGQG